MPDVLLVQNTKLEGSGTLGTLLQSDGFNLKSIFAKQEKLPKDDYSLVIILGAPESANDDLQYLKAEQELIQKSVKKETPLLGICLGSQLIAKAFGANVYRGATKEIGFYHDQAIDNATSKLFSGFENPFTVFHWHGDTFDLPDGATRLVHSIDYLNQAFQLGSAVGIQFHLEVDGSMIRLWLDKAQEKFNKMPNINPDKIRRDIDENISIVKNNMEIFYNNFKSEFNL